MELYCEHHDSSFNDDDTFLLDDENTNEKQLKCLKCNSNRTVKNDDLNTVVQIEENEWTQNKNSIITGMVRSERVHITNDNLDSPEDSPLLASRRNSAFGNLSIGNYHCHGNVKYNEDQSAFKKLVIVSLICLLFMVTELIGGYIAGSLAVMTDAAHLFSDVIGFMISLISIWVGRKPPSHKMTFGYHRAEVLGAFLSVMVIWVLAGTFSILAIGRLIKGEYDIDANAMLIISSLGLLVNLIMGAVLHGGIGNNHGYVSHHHSHEKNINVRAATAHVIGDILQSAGVLFTALIVKFFPEAKVLDPICTIIFTFVVVCATLKVAKDSFLILLESSQVHIGDLLFLLRNINGVKHVHSVRSWTLAPGRNVVAAHLAVDDDCDRDVVLNRATILLQNRLKIPNSYIQVESYDHQLINNCQQCQELQC